MAVTTTVGVERLHARAVQHLGDSSWHRGHLEAREHLRRATGDSSGSTSTSSAPKPVHSRAPWAPGYRTLSLTTTFMPRDQRSAGLLDGRVDEGCEKVRFPSPVRVGSDLRCGAALDDLTDVPGGMQMQLTPIIEVRGQTKPASVATILVRKYL